MLAHLTISFLSEKKSHPLRFCIGQHPSSEILQPFSGKNYQPAGRFREKNELNSVFGTIKELGLWEDFEWEDFWVGEFLGTGGPPVHFASRAQKLSACFLEGPVGTPVPLWLLLAKTMLILPIDQILLYKWSRNKHRSLLLFMKLSMFWNIIWISLA